MSHPNSPIPLNEEIKLDPSKTSMSKTDPKGIIEYANESFMEVCGYTESELMGRPHNIVRHPDMPRVVFKLMWERLLKAQGIYAVVKNMAKDGRFYWVIAKLETKLDENNTIISHFARRKAAPADVVSRIEKLYKTLKSIEEDQTPEVAEKYFYGLLEEKDISYDEFIMQVIGSKHISLDSFFDSLTSKEQKQPAQQKKVQQELPQENKTQPVSRRPIPIDKEIKLDASRFIMSKTDPRGVIEFANDYFMEICGYEEFELMGQPHNIIRHPDMPKVVFKLLWQRLYKGENIHALVKNLAKDGRYYWVLTNFETQYNEEGEIICHIARRKAAPGNAVYEISKLYKKLRDIEDAQGAETAEKYFNGLLDDSRITYDQFILDILDVDKNVLIKYFENPLDKEKIEEKVGFWERIFN